MRLKHMLKANKNELLSLALAGFLVVNSGFTAPHEVIDETPVPVKETPIVPVVNGAPTAISVSESGSIEIADAEKKSQFGLIETDAETMPGEKLEAEVLNDNEEELNEALEAEVEPMIEEEYEPIDTVEYVDEPQYAAVMAMEATAYLPTDGDGYGITATGIPATYGVAAVDPSVIPLGSRLYVPGYGEAIAADTGGAINGYRIDLCMESYDQAMAFGRRVITVFVID